MDAGDGRQTMVAGGLGREATFAQGAQERVGPSGNFPIRTCVGREGEAVGIVGSVIGGYDNHQSVLESIQHRFISAR